MSKQQNRQQHQQQLHQQYRKKKDEPGNSNPFKNHNRKLNRADKIFFFLALVVFLLASVNLAKAKGIFLPETAPIQVEDGAVFLQGLTLHQKIAQMVVVHGSPYNLDSWRRLQVGGIHLYALEKEDLYRRTIEDHQQGMDIPFFVTVDLEGCINPFANFRQFPANSDVTSPEAAYNKGLLEGAVLRSLGFSINFAPVVDLDDRIWHCRTFPGDSQQISQFAHAYINGLKESQIIATAKHYPGKTLVVQDPHKFIVAASIDDNDIYPYSELENVTPAIMISHLITSGTVDSQGLPAVVSPTVLMKVRQNFSGLIISDEINMLGLKNFYPTTDEMYIAIFKAGNDIILNFNEDPHEISRMIEVIVSAVEEGVISEQQIDESVRRILVAKGFTVE